MKTGNGKLSKWFLECKDEELIMLELMSRGALGKICYMLTLEQQLLLEKEEKSLLFKKKNV